MIEISKREEFYQQEYCGCVYSLRDTNRHRRSQGRERITLGVKFYGRDSVIEEIRRPVIGSTEPVENSPAAPAKDSGQ